MKNESSKVKRSWDSSAEERAYKILSEKINLEYYQLNKHVALKDIFVSLKREQWTEYHIDFMVEDKNGYPVLGIEINGIEHWNKLQNIEKDKMKKVLFAKHGIPLICIPLPELPDYTKEEYKIEYEKALERLINQFLIPFQYRTSYPAYCHQCGFQLAQKFKKDYEGAFYCCTNNECKCKTISASKIPCILNTEEN